LISAPTRGEIHAVWRQRSWSGYRRCDDDDAGDGRTVRALLRKCRSAVKIMVGNAPISQQFSDEMGADSCAGRRIGRRQGAPSWEG
jgi:hypothetical protein